VRRGDAEKRAFRKLIIGEDVDPIGAELVAGAENGKESESEPSAFESENRP
jgi:hypothetical protein